MADSNQTPHELIEQQMEIILKEMKNITESIYHNDLNELIKPRSIPKTKTATFTIFSD